MKYTYMQDLLFLLWNLTTLLSSRISSTSLIPIGAMRTLEAGSRTPALALYIVYRRDLLWSPANIKGVNKDAKIYVGRSTTLHNLLFCTHTLFMSCVTNTFLFVGSSVRSKQLLCFVQGVKGKKQNNTHVFFPWSKKSVILENYLKPEPGVWLLHASRDRSQVFLFDLITAKGKILHQRLLVTQLV